MDNAANDVLNKLLQFYNGYNQNQSIIDNKVQT